MVLLHKIENKQRPFFCHWKEVAHLTRTSRKSSRGSHRAFLVQKPEALPSRELKALTLPGLAPEGRGGSEERKFVGDKIPDWSVEG